MGGNLTINSEVEVEAEGFLKVLYNGKVYLLGEFAEKFNDPNDEFFIDSLFKNCSIQYKGKVFTYKDICENNISLSEELPITNIYNSEIVPRQFDIFSIDQNYYAAGKLVKSAEDQLMFGRYSLMKSNCIINFNVNLNWVTGYGPIYYFRGIDANNAIMWYNNVFDSIMQIIFIAFEIYKKHPSYKEKLDYHKILRLCDYNFLSEFYGANKAVPNFKSLWKIISKAQNVNININQWANYIKHKGGISYKGAQPEEPFSMSIKYINGESISNEDFKSIEVELDDVIEELKKVHKGMCDVLHELVDFIGFEKVQFQRNDGKLGIPQKILYKKVIFD